MAKQATDAEVMEYLWPTRRLAKRERTMNSPRITSVGFAAALLLLSALLFGERAEASWMNGQELRQYRGNGEVFSIALCFGYLMGVIDKLDRDHIALTGRPCTPEDDQILTHRAITMSYVSRNGSQLHRGAHYLVTNAVIEEFQCDDALSLPS